MEEYYEFLDYPSDAFPSQNVPPPISIPRPNSVSFVTEMEDDMGAEDGFGRLNDDSAESASSPSAPCTPDSERPFLEKKKSEPISVDEPRMKRGRYKSKDSERNRRNRINERLQELKELLPRYQNARRDTKETKEDILVEAIDYIRSMQSKEKKAGSGQGKDISEMATNSPTSPREDAEKPKKRKNASKRAKTFMILLFAVGLGLWIFPFLNPPTNHPLYKGGRLPRHHSRIFGSAANVTSDMCLRDADEILMDYYECPSISLEDPPLENIFKLRDLPSFCSVLGGCPSPRDLLWMVDDISIEEIPPIIPYFSTAIQDSIASLTQSLNLTEFSSAIIWQ